MAAFKRLSVLVLSLLLSTACSRDEFGSVTFTTWGEQRVEQGIPAGDAGFVDGWSVTYEKFLVNFHQLKVATASGEVAQQSPESYFADNVVPGRKHLVTFDEVTAKAWDSVSYQIKPAVGSAVVVAGDSADLEMMVEAGYSLFVRGSASKADVTKTFALGFTHGAKYEACHAQQNGADTAGIVVSDAVEDVSDLTTRGDYLFHDRLDNVETSLRFAAWAAADDEGDANGDVTLDELRQESLNLELYDPGDSSATTMSDFVAALARTVGRFRGEGECAISETE